MTQRKVSFSQYSVWKTCPKQWFLKYIEGHKEPQNINGIFGTAMHETIQAWLQLLFINPKEAKVFDLDFVFKNNLLRLFKEAIVTLDTGHKKYPCDQAELLDFYMDGVNILAELKQSHHLYFPTKGYELVGCEIGLEAIINPNIKFIGYIDIIIRHKRTGEILIIDLKTSKKGWWDSDKKDEKKVNQILLYKKFFSEQHGIDPNLIKVEYLILKRKLYEASQWKQSHLSSFVPAHGSRKTEQAGKSLEDFIKSVYTEDGEVLKENIKATPTEFGCKFCMFGNKPYLCEEGQKWNNGSE